MVENRAQLDPARLAAIERIVGAHGTLADVVAWGLAQRPAALVSAVVVQDEFTHDVVVPHDGIFLVYDAT